MKNGFPNTPAGDDRLLARYAELKANDAELDRLRQEIIRRARKRGLRRDGGRTLFGRRNYAVLVREPATWVKRHLKGAHWKLARVEVKK